MAVEHDLRGERWVPGHLDRDVSPLRIHEMKGVMVDVRVLLGDVADHPGRGPVHLPHRRRCLRHQHQKHSRPHGVVGGQVFLGDPMLAFTGLAVDDRHLVRRAPGLDPTGEPARHPHQMVVVQLLVAAVVQLPPPHPEPARRVPHRVVGVQHDPIHTVIRTGQQIPVPCAEVVGHPPTVGRPTSRDQSCPEGATRSGRSPGTGVALYLAPAFVPITPAQATPQPRSPRPAERSGHGSWRSRSVGPLGPPFKIDNQHPGLRPDPASLPERRDPQSIVRSRSWGRRSAAPSVRPTQGITRTPGPSRAALRLAALGP